MGTLLWCLVLLCFCFPSPKHRSCCARGCVRSIILLPPPWAFAMAPAHPGHPLLLCHLPPRGAEPPLKGLFCPQIFPHPECWSVCVGWSSSASRGTARLCFLESLGDLCIPGAGLYHVSLCPVTVLCHCCLALVSLEDIKGNFLQPHLLIFHRAVEQPAQPLLQTRAAPGIFAFSSWFHQLLL